MKISVKQEDFHTLIVCEDYEDLYEVIQFKENKLESTMHKWKYLRCLGYLLNNVGTNNPLKQLPNILTPTYRITHMLANCEFSLKNNGDNESNNMGTTLEKFICPTNITISSSKGKFINLEDIKKRLNKKKINFNCNEFKEFNIISLAEDLDLTLVMMITSPEDWEVQQYELLELDEIYRIDRPYEPSFQVVIDEHKRTFRTRYRIENLDEMLEIWKI